jgi:hypothetical protein
MFRSEAIPVQQVELKTERFADRVSIRVALRLLSVPSLSKIAHIYKSIVIGVLGNQARIIEVGAQADVDAAFQVLQTA